MHATSTGEFFYRQDRAPRYQVHATVPARTGAVVPPVFHNVDEPPAADTAWPPSNDAPRLRLLEFEDVLAYPRHVVVDPAHRQILPVSFKKHRNHRHGGVERVARDQFRLREDDQTLRLARPMDRPVYLADTEYPGIFGHDLIEVFTAAWAWRHAGADAVFATSTLRRDYLVTLLAAVGVPPSALLFFTHPLEIPTLLFPEAPVVARRYVHPVALDLYDRARHALVDRTARTPERIYVSRSRVGGRTLVNERAVEQVAEDLGFTVIHPQEHSIAEQITLFANASMIMGSGGSAMHNAVFSPPGARVLMVSSPTWIVVIDSLLDDGHGRLGYVMGTTERESPRPRHQGPWRVDPDEVRRAARAHFGIA